eukprot:4925683-Heterocapsa_arctica.AAC.1
MMSMDKCRSMGVALVWATSSRIIIVMRSSAKDWHMFGRRCMMLTNVGPPVMGAVLNVSSTSRMNFFELLSSFSFGFQKPLRVRVLMDSVTPAVLRP